MSTSHHPADRKRQAADQAPKSWAERAYPNNLLYFHEVDRGGHFAAWAQPALFSAEPRAAFRSLRSR